MTAYVQSLFLFGKLPQLDFAIFVQTDEALRTKFLWAHITGRSRLINAFFSVIAITDLACLSLQGSQTK